MSKIVETAKKSAMVLKDKAVHGAEVAVSVAAKDLLVEQVVKMLGKHFPKKFYETPIGKAVMDSAACYLVHVAASTFPTTPGASIAAKAAEMAMEGVARDSFTPLLGMGKELLSQVSEQFKASGMLPNESN